MVRDIAKQAVHVHRLPIRIQGNPQRTILRLFWPGAERTGRIVRQLMELPLDEVSQRVEEELRRFQPRHPDLERLLLQNARETATRLQVDLGSNRDRQLLVGACMSMEYAIEAAALFNPSMVPHLDQSGLAVGEVRFLLSMRAVGEGHLSSIVFRQGTISPDSDMELTPPPRRARQAQLDLKAQYQKIHLQRKLSEMHKLYAGTQAVLDALGDTFSYEQLLTALERLQASHGVLDLEAAGQLMIWIVKSNYKIQASEDLPIDELVLFPVSETESQGMEDMRLVRFAEDDGQTFICGTYTAFNGNKILPQMMMSRVEDRQVQTVTLLGQYAQGKGLALFPRRVNGQYMMLGRRDGQNHYLLSSDELDYWDQGMLLSEPQALWEIVQVGNCGPPIETARGWLVLTHGVGPLRRYCIGAMLLDLDDPSRVIGRLACPLLEPQDDESDGYVPNVVYSCGAMLHGDKLFIPYGISDTACGFAWVNLDELLQAIE